MSSGLNACLETLRFLARSSQSEATGLMTAELRIREFLSAVVPNPATQRAALEELDNAVIREAEVRPQYAAPFWQGIRNYIAGQLVGLNDD